MPTLDAESMDIRAADRFVEGEQQLAELADAFPASGRERLHQLPLFLPPHVLRRIAEGRGEADRQRAVAQDAARRGDHPAVDLVGERERAIAWRAWAAWKAARLKRVSQAGWAAGAGSPATSLVAVGASIALRWSDVRRVA